MLGKQPYASSSVQTPALARTPRRGATTGLFGALLRPLDQVPDSISDLCPQLVWDVMPHVMAGFVLSGGDAPDYAAADEA